MGFCLWKPIRSPFRIVKHRQFVSDDPPISDKVLGLRPIKTSWKPARCQQKRILVSTQRFLSSDVVISTQQSLVANGQRFWLSPHAFCCGPKKSRQSLCRHEIQMAEKWSNCRCMSWSLSSPGNSFKKNRNDFQPFPVQKENECWWYAINTTCMWKSDGSNKKKSRSQAAQWMTRPGCRGTTS